MISQKWNLTSFALGQGPPESLGKRSRQIDGCALSRETAVYLQLSSNGKVVWGESFLRGQRGNRSGERKVDQSSPSWRLP